MQNVSGGGYGMSLAPLRLSNNFATIVRAVSISVPLARRIIRAEGELAELFGASVANPETWRHLHAIPFDFQERGDRYSPDAR